MQDNPPLHPFPEGWYFVASRGDLGSEQPMHRAWMGQEIVVWADERGRVCVADAVCPHLGSSLAADVGARVRDGRLVCPFHGFEYDTAGRCVAAPYAAPPESARLHRYATCEIAGMVFGWWGARGRPPQWQLPDEPRRESGWSGLRSHAFVFPGHPQETTENSVDLAHLRYVHGYENVAQVGEVSIDGAYLRSHFNFNMRIGAGRFLGATFAVSAVTHVHGLGYSTVDIEERSIGYRARLWVLSTPVDGTSVELTIVSQVGDLRRPKGLGFGLRLLPLPVRLDLINRLMLWMEAGYVKQDLVIWRRKRYLARPRLGGADGQILAYRRYCEQFHADLGVADQRLQDGPAGHTGQAAHTADRLRYIRRDRR